MLTEERHLKILENGDGWDNAIAMLYANEAQKEKHSQIVLEIGNGIDNALAMRYANEEQKKRHEARIKELKQLNQ